MRADAPVSNLQEAIPTFEEFGRTLNPITGRVGTHHPRPFVSSARHGGARGALHLDLAPTLGIDFHIVADGRLLAELIIISAL